MAMDISDYSRFYKDTQYLPHYGSMAGAKDTLVKYEFNTTDEKGNRIMEPMTKEETLRAMNEISSMYGDNVIVQFSGDGMAKLVDSKSYFNCELTDEEKAERAAKDEAFQKEIVQLDNTHKIIIPNVQIQKKLDSSLKGVDESVAMTANGIIRNYLLPSDIGGMSESERREQIAFGLEAAKYLAENYLDGKNVKEFLSAMSTIAKYGVDGKVEDGKSVHYHIEKGNVHGEVDDMDILRDKAPDLYKEIEELNQSIINHKGGEKFGARFLELYKRAEKVLSGDGDSGINNRDAANKKYKKWQEEVESIELPEVFKGVSYTDISAFFDSLKNQGSLSNEWFDKQMQRMSGWLNL